MVEADVHPRARRGWISITCGDLGICCTITKEAAEKTEAVWGKDDSCVRINGTQVNKGDFIMIEDETLRFIVPKK